MANYILSPNMSLPVPVIGTETGPNYANDINNSLTLIDSHDHTSGKGALIVPSALNINTDLTFANNKATNVKGVQLYTQATTPGTKSIWTNGTDLYYTDSNSSNIQITVNGTTNRPPTNLIYSANLSTYTYSNSVGTIQDTGLVGTLVTTGRPVLVKLVPSPGLTSALFYMYQFNQAYNSFFTVYLRDSSNNVLGGININLSTVGTNSSTPAFMTIPISSIEFLHLPSAGSHDYKISVDASLYTSTSSLQFQNVKLMIMEL